MSILASESHIRNEQTSHRRPVILLTFGRIIKTACGRGEMAAGILRGAGICFCMILKHVLKGCPVSSRDTWGRHLPWQRADTVLIVFCSSLLAPHYAIGDIPHLLSSFTISSGLCMASVSSSGLISPIIDCAHSIRPSW